MSRVFGNKRKINLYSAKNGNRGKFLRKKYTLKKMFTLLEIYILLGACIFEVEKS